MSKFRSAVLSVLALGAILPNSVNVSPVRAESVTGVEVLHAYHAKAVQQGCTGSITGRWVAHFSNAPKQLADPNDPTLSLFHYVLEQVHEAGLPSEYAMIPFVESAYHPELRSRLGPTGLWQLVGTTARNFKVPMRGGYDGRLSPIDSTRGVVNYLKYLNRMFKGNEDRVIMAYNAGEGAMQGFLKGRTKLSQITHSYPKKINALTCLIDLQMDKPSFRNAMSRKVPKLHVVRAEAGAGNLNSWAKQQGFDPNWIRKLNPALAGRSVGGLEVLVHDPK